MLSYSEENHIKVIYHLSNHGSEEVTTNSISEALKTKPASVSDMLKKLSLKGLIEYEKYQGVKLSTQGKVIAMGVIRKHRLWEVFLVEKLQFHWDEVHDIAEQLEHINSELLTQRLDDFLGHPTHDPHGDPIPDAQGFIKIESQRILSGLSKKMSGVVVGVKDTSSGFLKYLDKLEIGLGCRIEIKETNDFDGSMEIKINGKKEVVVSKEIAINILVN